MQCLRIGVWALVPGLFAASGCRTASLHDGALVQVVPQMPRDDCKNLGPVFGKGGGAIGGAWVSDDKLMEYASNDLRNKAAAKGATHVVTGNHQMGHTAGEHGGSTSTATFSGVAYRCPEEVRKEKEDARYRNSYVTSYTCDEPAGASGETVKVFPDTAEGETVTVQLRSGAKKRAPKKCVVHPQVELAKE